MTAPARHPAALTQAYALLGLSGPVQPEALTRAFRDAVKAARPDVAGGDADRFRRVIAAYRLLQAHGAPRPALAAPRSPRSRAPILSLDPLEALRGSVCEIGVGDRRLRIATPAGLRTGEHLRLRGGAVDGGDLYLPVLVRPGHGLRAMGDDLYMDWRASERVLEDGGRIEIDTHAGMQAAWVGRGLTGPIRLRLKGLGLPARGARSAGHLFVTLIPCADTPSAAEDLLVRFTRVWTPERMAA